MAWIIIRDADLVAPIDVDDFNPNCLTDGARIYFDRYQEAWYTNNPEETSKDNMVRIK